MAYNSRIGNSLQSKYRSYYKNRTGGENLTVQERRVLDALRDSPQASQLFAITPYLRDAGKDTETAKNALYNVGVALGATRPDINSLWDRLSTGLTYDPYRELPEEQRYESGRVPGEGSMQGGTPAGFYTQQSQVTASNPELLRQLSPLLQPIFRNYLVTGRHKAPVQSLDSETRFLQTGERQLTAAERQFLDQVRENPTSVDVNQLKNYAIPGEWTAADPDDPDRQPSVSERINLVLQGERQDVARFEQNRNEQPNIALPENFSLQWISSDKKWGLFRSVAGRTYPEFVRPLTDDEVRLGRLQPEERETRPEQTYLSTGAEDIEPGELSRPGMGPVSGATPTRITIDGTQTGPTGPGGPGGPGGVVPGAEVAPVDTGVPVDWETAAAEMYPEYYAIVKNVPEIAELLKRYVNEGWSEQKFQAELRATNWWKTTTASARQWDTASALDPATYQTRVDEAAAAINQEALGYGIRLSDEELQKLALDSLRLGWGTQTITNAIGMRATEGGTAGATQLREGYYGQNVREIAARYGVTLADETFNSFVNRIAVGDESFDSFQDYTLTIAKALYPALNSQFDAGLTFEDAVAPYRQIAASTLELNPNDIDFMDPKWVTPITYMPDPQTGEQRLMNLTEWGKELRTNRAYGYEFTENAKNKAYSVVETLGNLFGRI